MCYRYALSLHHQVHGPASSDADRSTDDRSARQVQFSSPSDTVHMTASLHLTPLTSPAGSSASSPTHITSLRSPIPPRDTANVGVTHPAPGHSVHTAHLTREYGPRPWPGSAVSWRDLDRRQRSARPANQLATGGHVFRQVATV